MFKSLFLIISIVSFSTTASASMFKIDDQKYSISAYKANVQKRISELCVAETAKAATDLCLSTKHDAVDCKFPVEDAPQCAYFKGVKLFNDDILKDSNSQSLKDWIGENFMSLCKPSSNGQVCRPKFNPSLSSNVKRPDASSDCQGQTCLNCAGEAAEKADASSTQEVLKSFYKFFKSGKGVVKDCTAAEFKIVTAPQTTAGCYIEALPCKDFFAEKADSSMEKIYYPGLIKVLLSVDDISTCKLYTASIVTVAGTGADAVVTTKRRIYDDDKFAWISVKEKKEGDFDTIPKFVIDPVVITKVKDIDSAELSKRIATIAAANPADYCSLEQINTIISDDEELIPETSVCIKNQKLIKSAYANSLSSDYQEYFAQNFEDEDEEDDDAYSDGEKVDVSKCTEVKPDPDKYILNNQTFTDYCSEACSAIKEGASKSLGESYKKNCIKRCLKGKSKSAVSSTDASGKRIEFKTIAFKNENGKKYSDAMEDYNTCLVAAGVKMSKEKKWEVGMSSAGMAANLLVGLYGLYQQTSVTDDQFLMQMEMLKQSDQCYSLNPNKTTVKSGKKRSLFGWIFSGFKSTYKNADELYEPLSSSDPAAYASLTQTYQMRNPLSPTGAMQNMTLYDICLINKALASLNQTMQNQMLCNQLMGMGLLNQREYKACLMGKDLKYGSGAPGSFGSTEKDKPAVSTPEEKKEEEEEKKADAAAAGGAPSAGGGGGGSPSSSAADNSKSSPDYLRSPYYRGRSGGGLDYSGRPYGYDSSGLTQQSSTDLNKNPNKTGTDAEMSQNAFYDRLTGVHTGIRNNLPGTND